MDETIHKEGAEEVFDIKIRNGAGKQLRDLMTHYHIENARDLIALSLSLLDKVKGSTNIIIEKPSGSTRLVIEPEHGTKE